ncbi:hypothetical protein DAETH_36830 (plasmid) [Deinococcus aetherius]|uniref:Glycoside hydrolase n=1 Tax=Deinococcus aetherius TaxID=200252 RepID=A0ABN6RLH0_9DEIO|nr:hypothetical protein [Deinococcus aetherius]BDP43714.1 hypothetical protein DAETH_36830 [Deinococcus aetherius]
MNAFDFSFDPRDPFFDVPGLGGVRWGVQVFTTNNVYVLDPDRVELREDAGGLSLTCDGLAWAGLQRRVPGRVEVRVARDEAAFTWHVVAEHAEPIKSVKLLWRGLPEDLLAQGWWHASMPEDAVAQPAHIAPLLWTYPSGGGWTTPWACAGKGPGVTISVRDPQVRAKRLYVHTPPYGGGGTLAELVLEEDARHFGGRFEAPEVRLRPCAGRDEVDADFEEHLAFLERTYDLHPWETRPDLPGWARDARLVLNLHGQHWTGYVFNTFDDMAEVLRFAARQVDGGLLIAYVLGWEGRYYHSYPNFTPGEDLGGPEGFARLRQAARETKIHLMPMFGAHGANVTQYPDWERAVWRNRTDRYVELFNRPDWDADRSGEDDQVFLSPGEPRYRAHLVREIGKTIRAFDLDAVYLDTTAGWVNDPRWDMLGGYRALLSELHATFPDLFVAGEAWWDALLGVFPINLSWLGATRRYRMPQLLTRYARAIRHIDEGSFGPGSTGVHERGFSPSPLTGFTPGHLPSVNIVDGTLRDHAADLAHVCRTLVEGKVGVS